MTVVQSSFAILVKKQEIPSFLLAVGDVGMLPDHSSSPGMRMNQKLLQIVNNSHTKKLTVSLRVGLCNCFPKSRRV